MKSFLARTASLTFLAVSLSFRQAYAAPPDDANGAAPRPFYIVGHNPNKIIDAVTALSYGANALEPDITYASDGQYRCYDTSSPWRNATSTDTLFTDWLAAVHYLVKPGGTYAGQLALICFDMKDIPSLPAGFADFVLTSVRNILNTDGVDIPVIFNVGSNANVTSGVFDSIFAKLGPREGVQCDAVNDVADGLNLFRARGYTANATWATGGTDFEADGRGWTYIDHGAYRRASEGRPKSIPYMYIYSGSDNMLEMINSGADGLICDDAAEIAAWIFIQAVNPPYEYPPFSTGVPSLIRLKNVLAGRTDIRLATPADNPFQPRNEAYALHIVTGDEPDLFTTTGTDAKLTFTLVGANGESSITVDANRTGRMEDEYHNYVALPSRDLGPLSKIKIKNDGSGSGPDWKVASIQVTSARWLGPAGSAATPIFYNVAINAYVNGDNQDHEFALTKHNSAPYSNAWADPRIPALNTTSDPNGAFAKPWQDFFTGYNLLRPAGTLHLGAGTYRELSRIDKPCRIVKESAAPYAAGSARLVKPANPP